MKELRKPSEGNPPAKWEVASQWLSRFEDSDRAFNCDDRCRSQSLCDVSLDPPPVVIYWYD